MKNLARHIELLLRDNDCVILPGFGGFIAHNVPAHYVNEEGLYYPPSRSISFNAAITINDGLLAQSYMRSYQVDYARANYMIDVAIDQLIDTLDEEGFVTLPRIGSLTQDLHQSLLFTPAPTGIASPAHFGLDSFLIKELSQLHQGKEVPRKTKPIVTRLVKATDFHFNKNTLHRVLSTAAVFLLLLILAQPTGNHHPTDIASLHLTEILSTPQVQNNSETYSQEKDVPKVTKESEEVIPVAIETTDETDFRKNAVIITGNSDPTVEPTVEEAPVAIEMPITTEVPIIENPRSIVTEAKSTKTYHIIVASLPNHRGADETLLQYVQLGYNGASLIERDDRVRISLVQFADKDKANEFLKTLRQNEKFQNAWLLAVHN